MDTVKLSSKGQIVIPKAMRDDMHLPPGTEFVISMTGAGISLVPKTLFPKATGREVRGILAKQGRALPDDDDDAIKARIKMRLKKQDDASKE